MKAYMDILQRILDEGEWQENRTGIDTLVVPNIHFEHDMSDGFPLLTTKKMAWKTMATELQGFIAGVTSKKWFQDRNCKIWNEWCNPLAIKNKFAEHMKTKSHNDDYYAMQKHMQKEEDDLGPIYGYQWRNFNKVYDENDNGCMETYDQFNNIIQTLKTNPNDRRMVCSAWNPVQLDRMALPPCHLMWRLVHVNGVLHLHWDQRSCDYMCGIPINIASYGLLLKLICKETDMKPGKLSATFGNCHIYKNHINQAQEQLIRTPKQLPLLKINNWNGIYNWEATDIEFDNYDPGSRIKLPIAV